MTGADDNRDLDTNGIRDGEASALNRLGELRTQMGDHLAALDAQSRALQIHRELGNRLGEANGLTDMGILRMQQAGVVPVGYSNVAIEILADNAAPEAEAVYEALGMPFSALVFGLKQYYSQVSATTGKK